ncbi:hypothetical protein [Rhodococcus sp. 1168]|nr:hypothetical protein [Rhodococcus sp. 1168]
MHGGTVDAVVVAAVPTGKCHTLDVRHKIMCLVDGHKISSEN